MTVKQNIDQFKELFLTAVVASTMVVFAFTSCQSKDEKAAIQFTKSQYQELTYKKAIRFFGINRTELAEQMTAYLLKNTQIEVVSQSIKSDRTVFTLKLNLIDADELQGALKLFAQNQDKYDFDKISFHQAMQQLEKNEGRPLAHKDSFLKISMKNNIQKEMSVENSSDAEIRDEVKLSQGLNSKIYNQRKPASVQKKTNESD